MFKNLKLGTKIIAGFLAVVLLVAIAGTTGYWGVDKVGNALHRVANEEAQILDAGSEMRLSVEIAKRVAEELKNATSALASDDISQVENLKKAFAANTETFDIYADAILNGADIDGEVYIATDNDELASFVKQTDNLHNDKFQPAFTALTNAGMELVAAKQEATEAMETMEREFEMVMDEAEKAESAVGDEIKAQMAAANVEGAVKKIFEEEVPLMDCTMEVMIVINESRIRLEEIAQATTTEEIDEVVEKYNKTIEDADVIITAILEGGEVGGNKIIATDNDVVQKKVKQLDAEHAEFQAAAEAMIAAQRKMVEKAKATDEAMLALDSTGEEMEKLLVNVEELTDAEMTEAKNDGESARATATWSLVTIVISSVILGLGIGILLTRSITKVLNRIVSSLTEGSDQVTSAAGQVSSSSQSLAEGATEQAANLEETSSSLEEMASQTKQNADNAKQAATLAADARKAADEGNTSMTRMNSAIEDIQKSSDETAKIIKVIDEIAFQTNLLALNAAVEAARAGEAGKGFAVVAEEVRNLAMRSAEAAKNTSELIEDSVKNSKNGVDIAEEVGKSLNSIVEGIGKTADLIGEIAAASSEQSQGIDQVNVAVAQMDKVTQGNAANAEESASAAEEMSAQAEMMNSNVEELAALVGGSAEHASRKATSSKSSSHSDSAFHQIASGGTGSKPESKPQKAPAVTKAENAIPLENDEFKDFNS